jgi:hypothetical protein
MSGRSGLTGLILDFCIRLNLLVAFYLSASAAYLSLVFRGTIDWWAAAAMFTLVWQVYSFDRYVVHPEDEALSGEPLDRIRFVRRNRTVFHVLFDIKDRQNDLRAGIKTIANRLGSKLVVRGVQSLCLLSAAGVTVLLPVNQSSPLVLSLVSFALVLTHPAISRGLSSRLFFGLLDTVAALPLLFQLLLR